MTNSNKPTGKKRSANPGGKIDMVNHPSHYKMGGKLQEAGIEVYDVLNDSISHIKDPIEASLLWQTLKYLLRVRKKKEGIEDYEKSEWYFKKLLERVRETEK